MARAAYWVPRAYHAMPRGLRFVGPYHEAQARLRGRPPGVWTRTSNRFWMGQPRMLYARFAEERPCPEQDMPIEL